MKLCWEAMGGALESCVRGSLTFTPSPRLLHLEAMVPGFENGVVTLQVNFPWKITFDTCYTNKFLIRVCSRTLSISSEHNTI